MRRSNWTPSIVPRADDHDVYLVLDDLGGSVGSGERPTSKPLTSKPSSPICSPANMAARSGSYASTAPRACVMSPRISPRSFAGVATCSLETGPPASKTSSSATKGTVANYHEAGLIMSSSNASSTEAVTKK
jgi:hypothetical protein